MPVTSPDADKPRILAIYETSAADAATPPCAPDPTTVATEVPWFYKAGVAPDGARARLAAVSALRAAIAPLAAALQAAVEAGAATPAETSQLGLLAAWSRRLEAEASILDRELAALGQGAP